MRDRLREQIERELVVEREGWAVELVTRVTERLQREVPGPHLLETVVVRDDHQGAFTAPGRTIYLSRRLLDRLVTDDEAAFVIAHELAHHRLGHVPSLAGIWAQLPLRFALANLERWIAGTGHERDADLHAIEICLDAGYDPERCIAVLEYLDQMVRDYGVEDALPVGAVIPRQEHPPLRERIAAVRAHVTQVRAGHRLAATLAERSGRRRKLTAAAAGAAVLSVAALLWKRR